MCKKSHILENIFIIFSHQKITKNCKNNVKNITKNCKILQKNIPKKCENIENFVYYDKVIIA